MRIIFLFFVGLMAYADAYNIDEMLEIYRKENDLSNKTKNEALGHVNVYTRDDIERMQAYRLGDLIKSLRFFRYDENLLGLPDYLHVDPVPYMSDLIKIYINDHELTSSFAGSGVFLYGNMDLGFVDHVDVYTGVSSSLVSTEPSSLTIKIYTKDPSREAGGALQGYAGSRGTNHMNASYAFTDEALQAYMYASRTDGNRMQYTHDGHTISRDYEDLHALLTLSYHNISFDAEVLQHHTDPFLSYSMFATPTEGRLESLMGRAALGITLLEDDSLTLKTSFSRIDEKVDLGMDGPRWSDNFTTFGMPSDRLETTAYDDVLDVKLEKSFGLNAHTLLVGTQYRYKQIHNVATYNNGQRDTDPESLRAGIFSLYLQDDYLLSDQHMLTASGKFSHYDNESNRYSDCFKTFQGRLGYTYTSDTVMFKTFFSYMQVPTEQHVLTISQGSDITILDIQSLTAEYSQELGTHRVGIFGQYTLTELDENMNPLEENPASEFTSTGGGLEYDYRLDAFHSLKSMFYTYNITHPVFGDDLRSIGGFVRLLDTWGSWDLFNELVYYELLDSETEGFDYSAAIRYHATPDLTLSLKGSNIFDSAAQSSYRYIDTQGFIPSMGTLYYAPVDQLITAGLEYRF